MPISSSLHEGQEDEELFVIAELTRESEFIFRLVVDVESKYYPLSTNMNLKYFWNTEEPIDRMYLLNYEEIGNSIYEYPLSSIDLEFVLSEFVRLNDRYESRFDSTYEEDIFHL